MKLRTIFALLIISYGSAAQPVFDRAEYYDVLSSTRLEKVNAELSTLAACPIPEKEAYQGALLMKKAGLLALPVEKLKNFKSGRFQLESALRKDSANAEYHFLRLIIGEHAPAIVHYSGDLDRDSRFIQHHFKDLSPLIQKTILDYSRHSRILKPEDFDPKTLTRTNDNP